MNDSQKDEVAELATSLHRALHEACRQTGVYPLNATKFSGLLSGTANWIADILTCYRNFSDQKRVECVKRLIRAVGQEIKPDCNVKFFGPAVEDDG